MEFLATWVSHGCHEYRWLSEILRMPKRGMLNRTNISTLLNHYPFSVTCFPLYLYELFCDPLCLGLVLLGFYVPIYLTLSYVFFHIFLFFSISLILLLFLSERICKSDQSFICFLLFQAFKSP